MDLSTLVDYEQLFTLDIKNPVDDTPLGITFKIRSIESPVAKAVLRRHLDENTERRQKGKLVKFGTVEKQELEKAASYIASWDWGEHTYHGEVPELSIETATRILDKEGWIYAQVVEAATSIKNFTGTRSSGSKKR